jgi:hypothetical protein
MCRKFAILFGIGILFAFINLFQIQKPIDPPDFLNRLLSRTFWFLPGGGIVAATVGLLFPCVDHILGIVPRLRAEWNTFRVLPIFVGINQACTKITFGTDWELALTLSALSVGLWWIFDRSLAGFGLGFFLALVGTTASDLSGLDPGNLGFMYYMRMGCLLFSGSITFGNIGRQLADERSSALCKDSEKEHAD